LRYFIKSAGQVGPTSPFLYTGTPPSASVASDTAQSFGDALFESESFEEWSDSFQINVSAAYFIAVGFLGLLGAGAKKSGRSSVIVNITSTSGLVKISQDHVSLRANATHPFDLYADYL
jgi:NAD(P)-dependent dehydrogenase (short-subunit alcohol dehydrogenase family)